MRSISRVFKLILIEKTYLLLRVKTQEKPNLIRFDCTYFYPVVKRRFPTDATCGVVVFLLHLCFSFDHYTIWGTNKEGKQITDVAE